MNRRLRVKNVCRLLLPLLSLWIFSLNFAQGYVSCGVSAVIGLYQLAVSFLILVLALVFGLRIYIFATFLNVILAVTFIH